MFTTITIVPNGNFYHTMLVVALAVGPWSEEQFPGEHGDWGGNLLVPALGLKLLRHPAVNLYQNVHKVFLGRHFKHSVYKRFDEPGTILRVAPRYISWDSGIGKDKVCLSWQSSLVSSSICFVGVIQGLLYNPGKLQGSGGRGKEVGRVRR